MSGLSEYYIPPREEKNRVKGCLSMLVLMAGGAIALMVLFMIAAYFS